MKIYGDRRSGNCHKVLFAAHRLGLDFDWVDVDVFAGEGRGEAHRRRNPAGQVPVIEFDDGRLLAQSNAILLWLARDSELLPGDDWQAAKVHEWLFWEQYSHEPYVAVCRFQMLYAGKSAAEREPWRVERGEAALDLMQQQLDGREWLAGERCSVADLSLLAYTRLADEGGFDLDARPAIRAWIARAEAALGTAGALERIA